jgi:hypothetical protein
MQIENLIQLLTLAKVVIAFVMCLLETFARGLLYNSNLD